MDSPELQLHAGARRVAFSDASSRLNAFSSPKLDAAVAKPAPQGTAGKSARKKWDENRIHRSPIAKRLECSPVVPRYLVRALDETSYGDGDGR